MTPETAGHTRARSCPAPCPRQATGVASGSEAAAELGARWARGHCLRPRLQAEAGRTAPPVCGEPAGRAPTTLSNRASAVGGSGGGSGRDPEKRLL